MFAIKEVLDEHLKKEGTLQGVGNHIFFISTRKNTIEEIIASAHISFEEDATKTVKKFAFDAAKLRTNIPVGFCFLFESSVQVKDKKTNGVKILPHTICISAQTLDGQSRFEMLEEDGDHLVHVPTEVMPETLNGKWVIVPTDEEMKSFTEKNIPAYQDKFLKTIVDEYLFYKLFSTVGIVTN